MNERIKELAQEAGESVVTELFEEYMLTETEDGATLKVPSAFIAKFAELIVNECSKVNNQFIGRRIGEIDLDMVYKEHFGVEE